MAKLWVPLFFFTAVVAAGFSVLIEKTILAGAVGFLALAFFVQAIQALK